MNALKVDLIVDGFAQCKKKIKKLVSKRKNQCSGLGKISEAKIKKTKQGCKKDVSGLGCKAKKMFQKLKGWKRKETS